MAYIARRPWRDLVVLEDYFGPVSDLNLVDRQGYLGPDSSQVQIAEFLPFGNPQLGSLGDFVSRMLLIRIEYWQSLLQRFWLRCQTALPISTPQDAARWATVGDSWQRLQQSSQRLRQACLASPTAQLRKACMALLQVHACYRPGGGEVPVPATGPGDGAWAARGVLAGPTARHRLVDPPGSVGLAGDPGRARLLASGCRYVRSGRWAAQPFEGPSSPSDTVLAGEPEREDPPGGSWDV